MSLKIVHRHGGKQKTIHGIGSVFREGEAVVVKDCDGVEARFKRGTVEVFDEGSDEKRASLKAGAGAGA